MTNIADEIKKLVRARSGKPAEIEKLKKGGKIKPPPKQRGGARPGSGRKPTEASEFRRSHLLFMREHANEKIEVEEKVKDAGGKEKVVKKKMTHLEFTLMMMMKNIGKGDQSAIHEYLDRIVGKATQHIAGDEDEPVVLKIDF